MSLVAYDSSSDEESDNASPAAIITSSISVTKAPQLQQSENSISNGHISDEDDDFNPQVEDKKVELINSLSHLLPKPKNYTNSTDILEGFVKPSFSALPTPKTVDLQVDIEEDDEFLHKKPNEEIIEKPNANTEVRRPVKITIPSLKNFQDIEKEMTYNAKNRSASSNSKSSLSPGLLSILPKAKSERNFAKIDSTFSETNRTANETISAVTEGPCFVPDSVKHRRPATNIEDVDRPKPTKKYKYQTHKIVHDNKKVDSDESDDNNESAGDFFSFNSDQSLPNVSATEINALVAEKIAKIADINTNYLKVDVKEISNNGEKMQTDEHELVISRKRYNQEQQLNSEALQALVGGSTKRRRQKQEDIQVIDINSSQVLPNKDEWMRTALASSTTYQPTGVLVDEEPASGTRRKHQITYLAHKAKANEAELQAMWSANRQNRRAAQSKYGF